MLKHELDNLQITYGVFELIEDNTIDIETINAYKLMEAPYMSDCLKNGRCDKFTELLKQSELEIVETINKLVDKVKQHDKEIKELKEKKDGMGICINNSYRNISI